MRPRSLFKDWEAVARRLREKGPLLLGLDFDGTLSPIVPNPADARMPAATRALLKSFARRRDCSTIVISGRALKDLRAKVSIPGLIYSGSHGIEIQGPGLRFLHPQAREAARRLAAMRRPLTRATRSMRGVHLEDKRYTLSLHYRNARPAIVPVLEAAVETAVAGKRRHFEVIRGKKVFELRPRLKWRKGDALMMMLRRTRRRLPVFVGDDEVDEHAFSQARRAGGIGIRVGTGRPTAATHFLGRRSQMPEFLERLRTLLDEGARREAGRRA